VIRQVRQETRQKNGLTFRQALIEFLPVQRLIPQDKDIQIGSKMLGRLKVIQRRDLFTIDQNRGMIGPR